MAKIRGNTQILPLTITNNEISATAGIALTKLEEAVIQADGGQAFTANQSMGNFRLTNVADPAAPTDAVNQQYVDSAVSGIRIPAVEAIAATNQDLTAYSFGASGVTYDNGTAGVGATLTQDVAGDGAFGSIDAVAAALDNRYLVKSQTAGLENGVYALTTVGDGASVPWVLTRVADHDEVDEVQDGAFVFVQQGAVLADNGYRQTATVTAVGTTALVYTQVSGAGQILAGDGLTKSLNTINVVSANNAITANADNIEFKASPTAATLSIDTDGVKVADGTAGYLLIGKGPGTDTAFTQITGDVVISAGGVTAISSGVIVDADINASAAIAISKMATGANAQIIVLNGSGVQTYVSMSGDATIANTGAVTLAADVVRNADLVDEEVPSGTIDGVNVTFVLASTPAGLVMVFVNGLKQQKGASFDYTLAGSTITFVNGNQPVTGDALTASYIK